MPWLSSLLARLFLMPLHSQLGLMLGWSMVPPVRPESSLVLNLESSFTSQDPTLSITGLTSVAPISGGYGDGPVHQVLAVHA